MDIYIKPVEQFKLGREIYIKLFRPLCALSESGDTCFQIYQHFLKNILKLKTNDCDMSFYYIWKKEKKNIPLMYDNLHTLYDVNWK